MFLFWVIQFGFLTHLIGFVNLAKLKHCASILVSPPGGARPFVPQTPPTSNVGAGPCVQNHQVSQYLPRELSPSLMRGFGYYATPPATKTHTDTGAGY